jgi:hypothetical protein
MEKRKKKLIIFITGLHNKPQGCGASVASAAGAFITKRKTVNTREPVDVPRPMETSIW